MLIEFWGRECPHCDKMKPIVEQLEKEEGIKVEKLEVWHNEENRKRQEEKFGDIIKPACGGFIGVPAFVNTDTNKVLCGEATLEELKEWAK